ncbi:MAG: YcbK family protein [Acetobacterales bacterium]
MVVDLKERRRPRRRVLAGLAGIAGLVLAGGPLSAVAAPLASRPRSLSFLHLHTRESLQVTYWAGGYIRPALGEIDHLCRDFRTGEVHPIAPALLDLLHALRRKLGTSEPFQIVSAYRCPATNAKLAANSSGVAKKSLHMTGEAMDIRLADRSCGQVFRAARGLNAGGTGLYSRSNFVHVDVGRVRHWGG